MDRFYFRKIALVFCLLFSCSSSLLYAKDVNIITWWGYLIPDNLKYIEEACGVKIYYDDFYSNPEFLRRVKNGNYDIAIYSDTVYDTFINAIKTSKSDIAQYVINEYEPGVKDFYVKSNHLANTVYYQLALTGFLWNSDTMEIGPTDSIEDIFIKAKGMTVVILDEHVEVANLLSKASSFQGLGNGTVSYPSIDGISSLTRGSKVIISSNLGTVVKSEDFAFAFTWSGEAFEKAISLDPKFSFLIHPRLSHWSKDLLTLISEDAKSICTARMLSDKQHLEMLSSESYYFSPFKSEKIPRKLNNRYIDLKKQFYSMFDELEPLGRFGVEVYSDLDEDWQMIKTVIGQ